MERNSLLSLSLYVMGREELNYKWSILARLLFWKRSLPFAFRFSLCFYFRSEFERETMLSAEGLSLPAHYFSPLVSYSAIFGKMLWGQVPAVLKFLAFHSQWLWQMQFMAGLMWWLWECPHCRQLWVCWAGDSLCLSFNLPPSPNKCSGLQQGELSKLLRTLSSLGVLFMLLYLLVFAPTGLKLTLGCLTAIPLPPSTSLRCISHVTIETTVTPIQMGDVTWFHTPAASQSVSRS